MCTVSWLRQTDGYVLFCNRDERTTRQPALGPRISEFRGVSGIAPVDGDHGGSWIGVNQFGLTLCLLNRYGDEEHESRCDFTSRGLLLTSLLDCDEEQQVSRRLSHIELARYRPFNLLVFPLAGQAKLVQWTGHEYKVTPNAEGLVPLTSTSLKEPGIVAERQRVFELLKSRAAEASTELLYQFHRSHLPERGANSVCMHRDGAATVSLSIVSVGHDSVEFVYQPGPPCQEPAAEVVSMNLLKHVGQYGS